MQKNRNLVWEKCMMYNALTFQFLTANLSFRYKSLLKDCHEFYFTQRYQLLAPCITDTVEKIIKQHQRNTCALVLAFIVFMQRNFTPTFFDLSVAIT